MPDFEAQLKIPPISAGIGEARRFARDQLAICGLTGLADNATLLISELVTNALLHGGEGAVLTLTVDDLRVRAEVRDSSPAIPVVRNYSETSTTGRGMVIVDALAAAWGTYPVAGGKVVWFELGTGRAADEEQARREKAPPRPRATRASSEFRRPASGSLDGGNTNPTGRLAGSGMEPS